MKQFVEQLKPRAELKSPLDKIQNLHEAKATASTLFEGVIADCANASTNEKKFKK